VPKNCVRLVGKGALLFLYSVLFAELFIRLFSPQPLFPRYVTGTPWGVRGNIPNARYWHHTPEVDVEFRINGQGMRDDREYPYRKPPNTCRVAVFGDSFFVGYEVDLRDSFAAKLEAQLRTKGAAVEVLNFSVSGFGTAEMLRTYEHFGRKFNPDVVLFEWHSTDPDDNIRSGLYRLEDGVLKQGAEVYLPGVRAQDILLKSRIYRFIADNSQLYSLIREKAARAAKDLLLTVRQGARQVAATGAQRPASEGQAEDTTIGKKSEPGSLLSGALLMRAQEIVEAENKAFYVVEIPIRVSRTEFRSSATMLPPQTRDHLKMISPVNAFSRLARPDLKLYYEKGQGHFTPVGVQIVVDEAVKVIEKSLSCGGWHSNAAARID
jgi:hypothetical protein